MFSGVRRITLSVQSSSSFVADKIIKGRRLPEECIRQCDFVFTMFQKFVFGMKNTFVIVLYFNKKKYFYILYVGKLSKQNLIIVYDTMVGMRKEFHENMKNCYK